MSEVSVIRHWQKLELNDMYLLLVKDLCQRPKEWAPSVLVIGLVVGFIIKILWQTIKDIL